MPVHRRQWILTETSLRIIDAIHGPFKRAVGRYYFHPKVMIAKKRSASSVQFILNDGKRVELSLSGAECRVVDGIWHPEFGLSLSNQCLEVIFKQSRVDATFLWQHAYPVLN
jgi:hypothetical protein